MHETPRLDVAVNGTPAFCACMPDPHRNLHTHDTCMGLVDSKSRWMMAHAALACVFASPRATPMAIFPGTSAPHAFMSP